MYLKMSEKWRQYCLGFNVLGGEYYIQTPFNSRCQSLLLSLQYINILDLLLNVFPRMEITIIKIRESWDL